MRILIISKEGDGCGLAYRLNQEGHTVDLWIKNSEYKEDLKGYVNRIESWRPYAAKADLVLCDMVGFAQYAEFFQRLGKPTLCCNPIGDILELDRKRGMQAFEQVGINIPETFFFKTPAEAAKLEWTSSTGYVVKPFGNLDTGKTYIIPNQELYNWALSTFDKSQELIIQTRITDAIEVSTEGWFNGREWIDPFNHTFEEKYHMEGDVGKMTGCMGNVVLPISKPDRLTRETVMRLEPILRKAAYKGPIDVNCLVQKDRLFALEMTCRFGYDALEALMTGLTEPTGNMLFEVAAGIKKRMDLRSDFLIAVRVARDPYPAGYCSILGKDADRGMPITGLSEKDMQFVYLCGVYKENNTIKYAASDGIILKATAFGRSIKEARHRVYRVVKNVQAIDIQYRTDIGSRAETDIEKLRAWGWL